MDLEIYRRSVAAIPHGKRLPGATYLLWPNEGNFPPALFDLISALRDRLAFGSEFNVLKFSTEEYGVSFLSYPDFDSLPHPALAESIRVNLATGKIARHSYSNRSNPPILHRKETLLPPGHPRAAEYAALTLQEEEAGLYENAASIGFRENWKQLLAKKGLRYDGHNLVRCAADESTAPESICPKIHRHRTAIKRTDLSKPVKTLLDLGVLRDGMTFFDFGCGLGADVDGLRALGWDASGWDPVYRSEAQKQRAQIVNLGFVLNVIEDSAERVETLHAAWSFAEELLVVSTMIRGQESYSTVREFGDGVITQRQTFQKYFDQTELKTLIEDVLEREAGAIGIGIFCLIAKVSSQG